MTADGSTEKRATRKAKDCAWYLLATVYGEPGQPDYDHAKNRISWNRFVSAHLTDKRRAALRDQGFPESELTPFNARELADLESAYARRCKPGSKIDLPQPTPPFEGAPHPVIDFSHVQFDKFFCARGFLFPEIVQFWGAIFHDSANFSKATFEDGALFGKAQFAGANFDRATFNGSAHFNDTHFKLIPPRHLNISFGGAKFAGYVTFERAIIAGISFENAKFSGASSRFDQAAFRDGNFSNVVFKDTVVFENATFRDVRFDGGTFEGEADFGGAIFGESADGARSDSDRFREPASFVGAKFNSKLSFAKAVFRCRSTFVNSEMGALTSFVGAKFSEWPPLFFGSKLHEGTYWHGVEWPPRPQSVAGAAKFVDAYARLKLEMDRVKKHEDELDFFALEMQARRVRDGKWRGLPIDSYGLLCDYGRSYFIPLRWLLVLTVFGAMALWLHFGLAGYDKAFGLSIANTLALFGFQKYSASNPDLYPNWVVVVSGIQTVFGSILLFLLGLGIRNRFRMK